MKKLLFVLSVLVFIPFIIKAEVDGPKVSEITIAPKAIKQLTKKQEDSITKVKHIADSIAIANKKAIRTDTAFVSSVRGVKNSKDTAVFGDYIKVEVRHISYLIDVIATWKKDSIILFIDNIPLEDIHPYLIGRDASDSGWIEFHLDRKSKFLAKMEPSFKKFTDLKNLPINVGVKGNAPLKAGVHIHLYYIDRNTIIITFCIMILVIAFMLFFAKKFHFLQIDNSKTARYSLAQTQLAFWTIVVTFSYIYLWIVNGVLPELPSSVLILLGISMVTTSVAAFIDYPADGKKLTYPPSNGFLWDILSDDNGVNIQRAQMVIWTLILGYIYIQTFLVDLYIRDFDTTMLALMGISSGTYALLKTKERNEPATPAQSPVPPVPIPDPVPPVVPKAE